MRPSRLPSAIPIVLLLALGTACGDNTDTPEQSAAAVTLRIGLTDGTDSPMAEAIDEFVEQAAEFSDGQITIEPVWSAAGDPPPDDWEQAIAGMVVSGELDLALIASAAWDTEGVSTLRALNAPFLVDSDALIESIVTSELAGDLLAGLDEVGVTGLALWPEGLRHVFAFGEPLVAPEDFAGATIRAPRSDTVYALFEALGATAVDPNSSDFDAAVGNGSLAGAESSFERAISLPGGSLTAAGNVTLFPKVNTLVVNQGVFDGLSEEQRAALRRAADGARAFVLDSAPADPVRAQEYCAARGPSSWRAVRTWTPSWRPLNRCTTTWKPTTGRAS